MDFTGSAFPMLAVAPKRITNARVDVVYPDVIYGLDFVFFNRAFFN